MSILSLPRRARAVGLLSGALVLALATGPALATGAGAAPAAAPPAAAPATPAAPLTNLAHLDFLGDTVTPSATPEHTTYRLAQEPQLGVVWTYADRRDDGSYKRVGGGPYDEATNTWGQGAYNTDDLTRAAVVYLRHWRQFRDDASRQRAYELLRAVTYLQTVSGKNAGNVVLWMQPDGSLNRSPKPVELPDPSDSAESYWLARTVWALGEGYAAFAEQDPAFATFLAQRLDLALYALNRQSLSRYGKHRVSDGAKVPAWLITDAADASAEAVLGLSAYVATGDPVPGRSLRARSALRRYSEGIAEMSAGTQRSFPYGAILPWTHSRSFWHAWASQMPAALAEASGTLDEPELLTPAVRDAAVFTPRLLTSTGPINGWLPTPGDRTQIAYGVDSRVQSLLAVQEQTDRDGFGALAAMTAGWYFGANRAGAPMYDPQTGRTYDGLAADGTVNRNSGAESTIHGLLSMLALDAHPTVAATARGFTGQTQQDGVRVVEGEAAVRTVGADVVTPESAWTGESAYSGGAYLALRPAGSATWSAEALRQPQVVEPVLDLQQAKRAVVTRWTGGRRNLGRIDSGSIGRQGISEAPGALLPVALRRELPAGAAQVSVRTNRRSGPPARIDALLLTPVVSTLGLSGPGGSTLLLRSAADRSLLRSLQVPGKGPTTLSAYDSAGKLRARTTSYGSRVSVVVPAGGFTVVTRSAAADPVSAAAVVAWQTAARR